MNSTKNTQNTTNNPSCHSHENGDPAVISVGIKINSFRAGSPHSRGGQKRSSLFLTPILGSLGFTLVELIVVITILVILGTIAFTSLTGYSSNARDSDRVTTLKNIENGLDIHRVKSGTYPLPENIIGTGVVNNTVLSSVGEIADSISRIIKMNKTPTDPVAQDNYAYGTNKEGNLYQIAVTLENPVAYHLSPLVQTVYADSSLQARVNGNYPGYIKYMSGTQTYIANIPSLLFNNTGSTNLLSTGTYFVVDRQNNLPYKIDTKTQTQNKTPNEIIQAITNTPTATLTGVNITTITTATGVSGIFTGSLLASFGGNVSSVQMVILGGTIATTDSPTNGACGTANGQTLADNSTIIGGGACSTGTFSGSVAGAGPWSWQCVGNFGGTTVDCSALKGAAFTAVGGTVTTSGGYTIHKFTTSGTFQLTGSSTNMEYLVVAGGGGGASGSSGGGGAGGFRTGTLTAVGTGTYTVTVGVGGVGSTSTTAAAGAKGGDSIFITITSAGGGAGGGNLAGAAGNGGSGGGGGLANNGAGGIASPVGQGFSGGGGNGAIYPGAGGGGAGAAGGYHWTQYGTDRSGNGGVGLSSSISGTAVMYAGGGGGGCFNVDTCIPSIGGTGGGGAGGAGSGGVGANGIANTGGGGGGGGYGATGFGGNGGSGIIIVRYVTP